MTANKEAKRLVNQMFDAIGISYSRQEFEQAKEGAIICQRRMLKEYKRVKSPDRLAELKALTKAIYEVKYKK